jgi:hypothetical protein
MTETDEAFLKRMREKLLFDGRDDDEERLLSLARRGAAIPDEPTEAMIDEGCNCADDLMHCYQKEIVAAQGYEGLEKAFRREIVSAYRGMLSTALKEL